MITQLETTSLWSSEIEEKPIQGCCNNDWGNLVCLPISIFAIRSENGTRQQRVISILITLPDTGFTAADYSLLSWLQSVPSKTFDCPFEERTPKIDVHPLNRPSLEASWAEQILVQPIKPKMFPYSHMPGTRGRADILSRSLIPSFDGLSYGLGRNRNLQGEVSEWPFKKHSHPTAHSQASRQSTRAQGDNENL